MPTTREQIAKILISPDFTDGEKFVVRSQYRETFPMGNFEEKLWSLICAADDGNAMRIAAGFPDQVQGVVSWRCGDLGKRLRAAGLEI